ncbi:calbindin-32 isoform X2 [Lingula anatina]|uniref:Calbindin-32 isoform X2 n=1 Tax=Lingula anatina TaxID=7574 RepID=A0A1S3IY55_LINAN|nr:calbindin-32 isoform X2 [Lingula anatina]|eukprot:XP_013402479.1 calbindin-32 isoform X2 [Lingula anatina]
MAAKGAKKDKYDNFMRQFRDQSTKGWKPFTAGQFMDVWRHYDADGNGFIEGKELDGFLREFVSSVVSTDAGPQVVSDASLKNMKELFLDAYDENRDNKIEMSELAQILPMEESFLLLFRKDNPLESSAEFMKIWREFDKDASGYIEADELKNFLKHLLKEEHRTVSEEQLIEYTDTMLQLFDSNKDGKLQFSEMAKLLPVKENFLCRPIFKNAKITMRDVDRVFQLYDRDGNGCIENDELSGFLKDLIELVNEDYDANDLKEFKEAILKFCDTNSDGKLDQQELTLFIMRYAHASGTEIDLDSK